MCPLAREAAHHRRHLETLRFETELSRCYLSKWCVGESREGGSARRKLERIVGMYETNYMSNVADTAASSGGNRSKNQQCSDACWATIDARERARRELTNRARFGIVRHQARPGAATCCGEMAEGNKC